MRLRLVYPSLGISRGFSIICNHFDHRHEFRDRGGQWDRRVGTKGLLDGFSTGSAGRKARPDGAVRPSPSMLVLKLFERSPAVRQTQQTYEICLLLAARTMRSSLPQPRAAANGNCPPPAADWQLAPSATSQSPHRGLPDANGRHRSRCPGGQHVARGLQPAFSCPALGEGARPGPACSASGD